MTQRLKLPDQNYATSFMTAQPHMLSDHAVLTMLSLDQWCQGTCSTVLCRRTLDEHAQLTGYLGAYAIAWACAHC